MQMNIQIHNEDTLTLIIEGRIRSVEKFKQYLGWIFSLPDRWWTPSPMKKMLEKSSQCWASSYNFSFGIS